MRRKPSRRRLSFQALENRRVLANVMVTMGLDVVNANDGEISLREAVTAANADPDASTIRFAESLIDPTPSDEGYSIQLESQLQISESVSILGLAGAQISITGQDNSRIFDFAGGAGKLYVIEDLTLARGKADDFGGAVRITGADLTIRRSVIRDSNAEFVGGGLHAQFGTVLIESSSIVNNSASQSGGISLHNVDATIANTTISGNSASSNSGGIGHAATGTNQTSSLKLIHTTIAGNDGPAGQIRNATQFDATQATLEILNSVLANSQRGANVFQAGSGAVQTSLGGNIIDDGSGSFDANLGDLRADPMLGELTYDFVSGQYVYPLIQGSPAVDAGIETTRAEHVTDQTGQRRFLRDGFDAGAWERRVALVTTTEDIVDPDDNEVSLREAVTFTNLQRNIRTIEFSPALNGQPITLSRSGTVESQNVRGDIDFQSGDVTLIGNGRDNTIISGGGDSGIGESVFNLVASANVTMEGLTIRDGRATKGLAAGGAIADQTNSGGSLTLRDVRLTQNQATNDGGAIVVADTGRTTIIDSLLDKNSATRGGAIVTFGQLDIAGTTLHDNSVTAVGGAVQIQDATAVVRIERSTLSDNEAGFGGGAVSNVRGNVTILNSTLSGNGADVLGGAVFTVGNVESTSATTTIGHATITDNTTRGNGTGVIHAQSEMFNVPTVVTITNSILVGNDGSSAPDNVTFNNVSGGSGVSVTSNGNNLFDDNAFGIGVASDQLNVSVPVINPVLGENDGPTQTHFLIRSQLARCLATPVLASEFRRRNSVDQPA